MSKKVTKITVDEWMKEAFQFQGRPANSFTISEASEMATLTKRGIAERLNGLVRSGKLRKGRFFGDGKWQNYYIPVEIEKK